MFVEKVIHSYKVIDPESEIRKTGQGERIIIYLIPSVPPRKRKIRGNAISFNSSTKKYLQNKINI